MYCAVAYAAAEAIDSALALRLTDPDAFHRDTYAGERLTRVVLGPHHITYLELRTDDWLSRAEYLLSSDGYGLVGQLWAEPAIPKGSVVLLRVQHGDRVLTELHDAEGCVQTTVDANGGGRLFYEREEDGFLAEGDLEVVDSLERARSNDLASLARLGVSESTFEEARSLLAAQGHVLHSAGSLSSSGVWSRERLVTLGESMAHRDASKSDAADWPTDESGKVVFPHDLERLVREVGSEDAARVVMEAYGVAATEARNSSLSE